MALSLTERVRLGVVRPELEQLLLDLKDGAATQLGFTLEVSADGGTRSLARQAALYADSVAQGGGTLAYPVGRPGSSRHNYGAAFDVHIVAGGSAADGTGTDDDYRSLATFGESLSEAPGLTAGYFFAQRGQGAMSDPYHFQLRELLATSKALWPAVVRRAALIGFAIVGSVAAIAIAARRS